MQLGSLLLHQFNLMTLLSFKILLFMEGTKSVVNPLYDYFGLILNYAIKYYQYVPSLGFFISLGCFLPIKMRRELFNFISFS